jgi:hypothetical protein
MISDSARPCAQRPWRGTFDSKLSTVASRTRGMLEFMAPEVVFTVLNRELYRSAFVSARV